MIATRFDADIKKSESLSTHLPDRSRVLAHAASKDQRIETVHRSNHRSDPSAQMMEIHIDRESGRGIPLRAPPRNGLHLGMATQAKEARTVLQDLCQ
ncbi:MAG: hypothetical protein WB801_07590, partial [Candidatus Dormiibacterota bacterium]